MSLRSTRRRRGRRFWLLALAGLALTALLYYRPLSSYLSTRTALAERQAEVRRLAAEKRKLERELSLSDGGAALVQRARRLGLVRAGERLFIVTGIAAWRQAQRAARVSR
jgi:cell division protein FtsB